MWFGLVGFYGISTIVGYLMPNPLYTYISNIYDLVWFGWVLWHINHCKLFYIKPIFMHKTVLFQAIQVSISTVFVCTQLIVKTVLLKINQFNISTQLKYQNSSISKNSV